MRQRRPQQSMPATDKATNKVMDKVTEESGTANGAKGPGICRSRDYLAMLAIRPSAQEAFLFSNLEQNFSELHLGLIFLSKRFIKRSIGGFYPHLTQIRFI